MKILLATDGSEHAEAATKFVRRLRCTEPVEIVVLTNDYLPTIHARLMAGPTLQEYSNHQAHVASENLSKAKAILKGVDATVTDMVAEGAIGPSIVEAAEKLKADLIVVGAQGHSAVHRVLLGSVSDYVASHADCSVVVIRPGEGDDDALKITLAIDDTPPSDVAVEQLKKFDWGAGSEGELLSVVPLFKFYRQDLVPSAVEHRRKQRKATQLHAEHVIEQLRDHPPKFSATVIEAEHPGEAIIEFLASHPTDLLAVGGGQHSRWGRILLGSVSSYVLRHAHCSVWIARRRKAAEDSK